MRAHGPGQPSVGVGVALGADLRGQAGSTVPVGQQCGRLGAGEGDNLPVQIFEHHR